MATEFLIEAVCGGSTTLRVVTSAFGTGADWENEFFTNMTNSWLASFDNLRLYVSHFDTKPVTIKKVSVDSVATDADSLKASLRRALNIGTINQLVDTPEGRATVERHNTAGPLLLRLDEPAAKIIEIEVWPNSGETICELTARCFNPSARLHSETWKLWLTEATIPAL